MSNNIWHLLGDEVSVLIKQEHERIRVLKSLTSPSLGIIDESIRLMKQEQTILSHFNNLRFGSSLQTIIESQKNITALSDHIFKKIHQSSLSDIQKSIFSSSISEFNYIFSNQVSISDSLTFSIEDESDQLSEVEQQAVSDILHGKKIDNTLFSKETLGKIFTIAILIKEFIELIVFISSFLNVEPIQLLESSPAEFKENIVRFCSRLPKSTQPVIEIRDIALTSGSLTLRKYDRKNAPVLAQLDNGTRVCVLQYPKGNERWLKVAVKNDNGETLVGYVARKYTKKINFVITK